MTGLYSLQMGGAILLFKYHNELMDSDRFVDTVWLAEFVISLASRHLKLETMFFWHDSSNPWQLSCFCIWQGILGSTSTVNLYPTILVEKGI